MSPSAKAASGSASLPERTTPMVATTTTAAPITQTPMKRWLQAPSPQTKKSAQRTGVERPSIQRWSSSAASTRKSALRA
jgi:hypothetical protein